MTATQTTPPPPAGINTAELFEPDRRDWLRMLGGVLLAAGATVTYVRKFQDWGDFPLFLVVLLPFVALYGLGWLAGIRRREDATERPEGWHIVFKIHASLCAGVVMAQLILLLGADDLNARLHQVLIGLAVAGAAYAASFLRHVPVLALIGGLGALWAWIFLWDKILEIDSIGTARVILLIFAVAMLAAGIFLRTQGREQADDFITIAGVTAIIVGLLSLSNLQDALDPVGDEETRPSEAWNVFLLIVSLALITYGAKARTRGPSYVGAIGIVSFIGLTGANVVALTKGNSDDVSKFFGWPFLLLLLGIAALVASFVMPRAPGRGWWETTRPGPAGPEPQGQVPPQQPAGGAVPPDRPTQVQPQPDQPTRAYPQQQPPPGGQPPGGQPPPG